MPRSKRMIVNADDFGFTRDVNDGIIEAHRNGIVTATTIMACGHAFDHAVRLAQETPTLDVGVHLVLVGLDRFPRTVAKTAMAILMGRLRVYEELDAQIRHVLAVGLRPTHLDSHKHTHILPTVLGIVARLAQQYNIPWVRRPLNLPILTGKLRRSGCRITDRFDGFPLTGKLDTPSLVRYLDRAPAGLIEFMCHPGYCTEELRSSRTRLKESRQRELEALTSPEVRSAIERNGIQLTNYREAT